MRRRAVLLLILTAIVLAAAVIIAGRAYEPEPEETPETYTRAAVTYSPAPTPETTVTPDEPEETPEPASRYADIEISESDKETLACLVYHEARGESFEGQVAVIEVVLNRCLSEYFPDTVDEVVFQRYGDVWQFSPAPYIWTAEPGETQYEAIETALTETEYILSADAVFFSTAPYNDKIEAVIGNHYFCTIN